MTEKENNILNSSFLDFDIIVTSDNNTTIESNQIKHLVVYQEDEKETELYSFLEKILKAVQIDLEKEVFPININETKNKRFSFVQLRDQIPIQSCIFFGTKPSDFGLNFQYQLYKRLEFNDCQFLMVDGLKKIKEDKQLKGALWTCLKEMYQV